MGKTWERRDLCLGCEFQILYNSREFIGAGNRIRTGDPDLGKVVLYQLSYSRSLMSIFRPTQSKVNAVECNCC